MNHRERVSLALSHKEPDRVPIDLWGSGNRITDDLYFNLLKYLGLNDMPEAVRPGKSAAYVDYRISDLFDADFRHPVIRPPKNSKGYVAEDGTIFDEWGIGYKKIGPYYQMSVYPLANADLSDIDKYEGPFVEDEGRIIGLEEEVKNWYENTDYAITATAACSGLSLDFCCYLRGLEQFLCDMYLNKKFAHKLLDKVSDIIAELYVYFVKPIGKYIEWVEYESDYGTQDRPLISKEIYEKFMKKPNEKIFNAVKKVAPDSKVFMHSCGSVRELIPAFIDSGIDILNSLQPQAKGMDSFELKKDFGNDIIFHGGVDIQGPICGTLDEAIKEAKTRIKAFAPGGGYIFASTNNYQPDIPVENFIAAYKTATEFGIYPININKI